MKTRLRIVLPKLAQVDQTTTVAFALFERSGRVLRSGEQPLEELAHAAGSDWVEVILDPDDAVVAAVNVPPVRASQLEAAVTACVEPLALSRVEALCIAYGPRAQDGKVDVTWTDRTALLRVWQLLENLGLKIRRMAPLAHALPPNDTNPGKPLGLPVDARWQTPLPVWSFARTQWRPRSSVGQWKSTLYWVGAAVLVWVLGLQFYAYQLTSEMNHLRLQAVHEVQSAFPQVKVVIDPLRQARNERDALLRGSGAAAQTDFVPLGLAVAALLAQHDIQLEALRYHDEALTLFLVDNPATEAAFASLKATAATQGLMLTREAGAQGMAWHFARQSSKEVEAL